MFRGKVALVTGASSGIGKATALAFAREGAAVAIGNRRVAEGEETVGLIRQLGSEGLFVPTDVADTAQIERLVQQTMDTFGRLDYAFNNAGTSGGGSPVHLIDETGWERALRVNLTGTMTCMKYELQQMLKQGHGAIVNNSSVAGLIGTAYLAPAYHASKHGILGLTKTAALEYAKQGIRINAVCPGWVETPMVDGARRHIPGLDNVMLGMEPMGRIGNSEEVANAVLWLCSDGASFVTGHSLVIDGGLTAQ